MAVAALAVGSGALGGDAPVYAHQAASLDLSQRAVHLGYIVLAAGIDVDWLAVLAGGALVMTAVGTERPVRTAVVLGGCALPWMSWGEVDLVWVTLLAWAVRTGSNALVAVAVAVSPAALLGLGWVGRERGAVPIGVAVVTVVGLTLVSGGDWWWGDRGVLHSSMQPGKAIAAFVAGPQLLLLLWARPVDAVLLLLFLTPGDVPAWLLVVPALADRVDVDGVVGGVLALGLVGWWVRWDALSMEQNQLELVAAQLETDEVLVTSWSDGVRVALLRTGDPYGLRHVRPRKAPCGAPLRVLDAGGLQPRSVVPCEEGIETHR